MLIITLGCINVINAQQYWSIDKCKNSITWQIKQGEIHHDHIEMSGKQVSIVLRYGVNKDGAFELNKSMIWPMLRTIPNNTHASLMRRFDWDPLTDMKVNSQPWSEQVKSITLNGTMEVISCIPAGEKSSLTLKRTYFPSVDLPSLIEIYEITNTGEEEISIEMPSISATLSTNPKKGVDGSYKIRLITQGSGAFTLSPGKSYTFYASISGYKPNVKEEIIESGKELSRRKSLVDEWMNNLVLETPDPVLDRMFAFSKIRACESIYETKEGPMHGPGGESYYAAIWTNDQAEYINPYFPFIGYQYGNQSAFNSFEHFARYMNNKWEPIPSSIIAEGEGYWNGAGAPVSFEQTGAFPPQLSTCAPADFQSFHTAGHPCPVARHRRFFRGDDPDRHQKASSQDVAFILSRNPDRRFFLCRYCLPHAESARPVGGPFYLSRSRNRHERIVFPVFSKSSSCIFTGHGSIHDRSDSTHGRAQSRHRLLSGSTRLRTDCAR